MSLSLLPWLSYVRELHVSLSLLISLQVNSHSHEHKREGGSERVMEGGDCEKVIEHQQLRENVQ